MRNIPCTKIKLLKKLDLFIIKIFVIYLLVYLCIQELSSELEFIQSLSRDLRQRYQTLPLEVPDMERQEIKGKLERLQRQISDVGEELARVSGHDVTVTPRMDGASALVALHVEVLENKPPGHEVVENGGSDLGDSESGVSSMESFEGIVRRENGHMPGENALKENGLPEEPSTNGTSNEGVSLNEGIAVSPDEYQRILMNNSAETSEHVTLNSNGLENGEYSRNNGDESRVASRESGNKPHDVSVPLLTVTDEDGSALEVQFAENVTENSSDNFDNGSFSGSAGEFFIDDFDVYYGQDPPKIVVEPAEASAGDNTDFPDIKNDEPDATQESSHRQDNDKSNVPEESVLSDQAISGISGDDSRELSKDQELTENAETEIILPSYKAIPDNALHEFDISADLETGDDRPRHSTPSELPVSTAKEEDSKYGNQAEELNSKPEGFSDSTSPLEEVVTGDIIPVVSNNTRALPQPDEVRKRNDKRRRYEAVNSPSSSETIEQAGQDDQSSSSVISAPNDEMDKLDRLLRVGELDSEVEKPQDRIASILAERRKAEEAERLRFAETSVRDPDYELFTSRPLDLMDRSSPLKELDESGNLLHEDMSLEDFLVEVEKLVEKLRSIEELITTELDSEDNMKDELAKHVVSEYKFFIITVIIKGSPFRPKISLRESCFNQSGYTVTTRIREPLSGTSFLAWGSQRTRALFFILARLRTQIWQRAIIFVQDSCSPVFIEMWVYILETIKTVTSLFNSTYSWKIISKVNVFLFNQALCVVMSKQQDRLDQMNLLSHSFLHGSASLNIILEERLREVLQH